MDTTFLLQKSHWVKMDGKNTKVWTDHIEYMALSDVFSLMKTLQERKEKGTYRILGIRDNSEFNIQ